MDTIRKMLESGVDDETIRSTLKDIGFNDKEVEQYLAEAKGKKPAEGAKEYGAEEESGASENDLEAGEEGFAEEKHEENVGSIAETIKEHLNNFRESHELGHTTTHTALEEQSSKLDELKQRMEAIHSKVESMPASESGDDSKLKQIEKKLSEFERELADLKAGNEAVQSLLKKEISTNRDILNSLEK